MTAVQAARTSLPEVRHLVEAANRATQERWEIARWMRWHALQLSPDVKPYNKPKSPKAMMPFPWDEPEPEVTVEDCYASDAELAIIREAFSKLKS